MELFLVSLSQEHPSLARNETIRLFGDKIRWKNNHIFTVEGNLNAILKKARKSGAARLVFRVHEEWKTYDIDKIGIALEKFDQHPKKKTFAVKAKRLDKPCFEELKTSEIEKEVGSAFLMRNPGWKVDLKNPAISIHIVLWEGGIILAELLMVQKGKDYNWKAPKNLPHFRGGAMKPVFARMMANLVIPEPGEWVLDPFCGHGGLLLELVDIEASPVGIELDRRIVRQAQENFKHIGYDQIAQLVMGDAFHLPFRKGSFRKMVCDPPYAIQTTTSGRQPAQLVHEWLKNVHEKVELAFALPNNLLPELPKQWKILMEADSYVHKNLTRRVRLISNE
ncbi:MAG: methyltransferase domain-containing protein [Methanobacteriota archaeon]|nr:MAG: methyltransferase domain-containing protein [Euryarchaeota archaeon]